MKNNMKDLIAEALDSAFADLENRVPNTKLEVRSLNIQHLSTSDLIPLMKLNNMPSDAYFDCADGEVILVWKVQGPIKEEERTENKNKIFHDISFQRVHKVLTANGYKRFYSLSTNKGISYRMKSRTTSVTLFNRKSIYEMYLDKNLDGLVKYYSLYFKKNEE